MLLMLMLVMVRYRAGDDDGDDVVQVTELQQQKAELEQLQLLSAEAPGGWYAHAETHRGTYAMMDNRLNFTRVLAELRALKPGAA